MTEQDPEGYVKMSISMPRQAAEGLKAAVAGGAAPSVSALITQAVEDRLAREETLHRINTLVGPQGIPEHALAWARQALGVEPAAGQGRKAS